MKGNRIKTRNTCKIKEFFIFNTTITGSKQLQNMLDVLCLSKSHQMSLFVTKSDTEKFSSRWNDYYGNAKYNITLRISYWIDFVETVIITMMYENLFD